LDTLQAPSFSYELKDIGPPKHYLGVTIGDYDLDGYLTKFISAEGYLAKALPIIKERFGKLEQLFPKSRLGSPASTD